MNRIASRQLIRHFADLVSRRPVVYFLSFVATLVWIEINGRDGNWDQINYHIYSGYVALHDRFAIDFFPASVQSYLTPYAEVPFYLLASTDLPTRLIAAILGFFHCLDIWVVYEIALLMLVRETPLARRLLALAAVLFALLDTTYLIEAGTSFADVTTGLFTLLGLWLLFLSLRTARRDQYLGAGLLMGVATALKLSNVIYIIAALLAFLWMTTSLRRRLAAALGFLVASGVAYVLIEGYWSWRLWETFGNPFFPMFNGLFHSPDYTESPLRHARFLTTSWSEFLMRPFAMVLFRGHLHTELPAPDLRYALIFSAVIVGLVLALVRAVRNHSRFGSRVSAQHPAAVDLLRPALLVFFVSWFIWLLISGNSRYFLPMGMLVAPLLVMTVWRVCQPLWKFAGLILVAGIIGQVSILHAVGGLRWTSQPWSGPWIDVRLPPTLRTTPELYIGLEMQSASFLIPSLPAGSAMTAVSGQYTISDTTPGGRRLEQLINQHMPNVRSLFVVDREELSDDTRDGYLRTMDDRLSRFGLFNVPETCSVIMLDPQDPPATKSAAASIIAKGVAQTTSTPGHSGSDSDEEDSNDSAAGRAASTFLMSCQLERDEEARAEYEKDLPQYDIVFDRLERVCPNLFSPHHVVSEWDGDGNWRRFYLQTDVQAWTYDGWLKYVDASRGGEPVFVGRVEDWLRAPGKVDCAKLVADSPPPAAARPSAAVAPSAASPPAAASGAKPH